MFTLFFVIMSSSGSISTTATNFGSETDCLKAISKLIDMEGMNKIKVQARCVKNGL